jgi:hypothetical protein
VSVSCAKTANFCEERGDRVMGGWEVDRENGKSSNLYTQPKDSGRNKFVSSRLQISREDEEEGKTINDDQVRLLGKHLIELINIEFDTVSYSQTNNEDSQ